MFDIASSELLVVAIVALLVVGPKDLPKLMRTIGQWIRRGRMLTAQFRAGFEQMMLEAEFQEQRERIMKAHPDPAAPPPPPAPPPPGEGVQTFSAADTPLPHAGTDAAAANGPDISEAAAPAVAGDAAPADEAPRAASEQRV